MNIKRVKWSYLNIKKQKLEYRAELQRIKDSREVIPDPMRSEESMKLIEEIFKKMFIIYLHSYILVYLAHLLRFRHYIIIWYIMRFTWVFKPNGLLGTRHK